MARTVAETLVLAASFARNPAAFYPSPELAADIEAVAIDLAVKDALLNGHLAHDEQDAPLGEPPRKSPVELGPPIDLAKYLTEEDDRAELLADAQESGDATYIAHAEDIVRRSRELQAAAQFPITPPVNHEGLNRMREPRRRIVITTSEGQIQEVLADGFGVDVVIINYDEHSDGIPFWRDPAAGALGCPRRHVVDGIAPDAWFDEIDSIVALHEKESDA